MKRLVCFLVLILSVQAFGRGVGGYVSTSYSDGDFKLFSNGVAADVYVNSGENVAVGNIASIFAEDVGRITGVNSAVKHEIAGLSHHAVIVGTLGNCPVIDDLAKAGKIDVSQIRGQWESFVIQVVPNPVAGVDVGLVIAGSDRRGVIYGMFDVSENMGVSPWYWFADVHPLKQTALIVKQGRYAQGPPSVKYRGIFINDEDWGMRPWATKTYAPEEGNGLGPKTYARIFELLLRLRANYIWPAMRQGTKPFNAFDKNKEVANEFAIVMGSSHIEPMLRNNIHGAEWDAAYPGEAWNYQTNRDHIYKYWEDRVKANGKYENIYTLGKRGQDDGPGPDTNVPTLEKIFSDQQKILHDWVNPDVSKVPQVLIAYTEILGLVNKGMRVPDDVTLCYPDDNWGYIRQFPNAAQQARSGGSGVYYHYEWLQGASECYIWLHTTPLGQVWQQMHQAYDYNVRKIWVVNVGDIKPAEFAIEFFMRMGRDITPWDAGSSRKFLLSWAARDFGDQFAQPIADILEKHFKLAASRRPELMVQGKKGILDYDWFSLDSYGDEAQRRIDAYTDLIHQTDQVYDQLPDDLKDAFFETVLYNVKCAGLHNLKVLYAQKSHAYGAQGRASAAEYAQKAKDALDQLNAVIAHYNTGMVTVGAKWNRMADMPGPWGGQGSQFKMPPLSDFAGAGPAALNVALDGGDPTKLPQFSVYPKDRHFIDLYNSGTGDIQWTASVSDQWVHLSESSGTLSKESRLWASIDWEKVPTGTHEAKITFSSGGTSKVVSLSIFNPATPRPEQAIGFVESGGCVSIHAEHFSRKVDRDGASWTLIDGMGRSGKVVTVLPPTIPARTENNIQSSSPVLEYDVYLFSSGQVTVNLFSLPTHRINADYGQQYAVSFDDAPPQIITHGTASIAQNVLKMEQKLTIDKPGHHVLKVWMVDPGMVLDQIVIDTGGVEKSYLGPPESFHGGGDAK